MNVKELWNNYKNIVPYAFFGVITTMVNVVIYWIMARCFKIGVMPSTIIAWTAAVSFAYITNRRWVFHSMMHSLEGIIKESFYFFSCRIATGVIDWLCMYIFVELICVNDLVVKASVNIMVILLNYIASRLIVFK